MLDALSCSCLVLASDQACTREYIIDGRNGLLCDFFDAESMARRMVEVLRDPAAHRPLGEAARRTVEDNYSLDVCLPRIKSFFEEAVAMGPRTPSVRCEALARPGARAYWSPAATFEAGPEVEVELPPFEGAIPFRVAPVAEACHSERSEESHVPARRTRVPSLRHCKPAGVKVLTGVARGTRGPSLRSG